MSYIFKNNVFEKIQSHDGETVSSINHSGNSRVWYGILLQKQDVQGLTRFKVGYAQNLH